MGRPRIAVLPDGLMPFLRDAVEAGGAEVVRPERAVRRAPDPVPAATRTVGTDQLQDGLAGANLVVVALALTPQTRGIIDAAALAAMEPNAWLVNVARGGHVVTDDLVAALRNEAIG